MISPWKLKRESLRVVGQIFGWPLELARLIYFRRCYDMIKTRLVRKTPGNVPVGREMAIYVIYPSRGIMPSHLFALREMNSQGIAPLVVSNLPLDEQDRARVVPLASAILERPNVGYDFGGYRDGVLELAPQLPSLERLWILNDSCWMVPQPTSWFDEARRLGVDFVGASSNFGLARQPVDQFRKIVGTYTTRHKNFHYASYALGFSKSIIENPAFLWFWRRLEIRNDKKWTVRRGEIGLTQWIISHGFSHDATRSVERLDGELANLDDLTIDQLTRELVIPKDQRLLELASQALLQDRGSPAGRAERVAFILNTVARHGSVYALASYNSERGFQFLKKSPLWLSEESAKMMMAIIGRLNGPGGNMIRREAEQLRRRTVQNSLTSSRASPLGRAS